MRFWPVLLLIFVSCEGYNDSIDKVKCLSCHFFLGKKGDDNYVILQENIKTKKMEIVVDSIDAISSQNCNIFFQRKNEYTLLTITENRFRTSSFRSEAELFEYCHKSEITTGDQLPPARSMYENLLDRVACE